MLLIASTARISPLAGIEDSVRGSRIIIDGEIMIDAFVKIKPSGGTGDVRIVRGELDAYTVYGGQPSCRISSRE